MLERIWSAGKCQTRSINPLLFLDSLLYHLPPTFPNFHYLLVIANTVLLHEHTTFFLILWMTEKNNFMYNMFKIPLLFSY